MVVDCDLGDGLGMRLAFPVLILALGSAVLLAGASPGLAWALLVLGATLATLALTYRNQGVER